MVLEGLGSIVGGIAGLAMGDSGAAKYRKDAMELWKELETSDFDYTKLTEIKLKKAGQLFPDLLKGIIPNKYIQIAGSPEMRQQQIETANYLKEIGQKGMTEGEKIANQEAQRGIEGAARGTQENVIRDLGARGRLGGGQEAALRMMGNQQSSNLARNMANDTATRMEARKMAGMTQGGELAGRIRGQDVSEQEANANISNEYSQSVADIMNRVAAQNNAAANQAQAANLAERQRIADTNEMAKYTTAAENLNRKNALLGTSFDQNLKKTSGQAGAYNTYADSLDAAKQAKIAAISGIAGGIGSLGEQVATYGMSGSGGGSGGGIGGSGSGLLAGGYGTQPAAAPKKNPYALNAYDMYNTPTY